MAGGVLTQKELDKILGNSTEIPQQPVTDTDAVLGAEELDSLLQPTEPEAAPQQSPLVEEEETAGVEAFFSGLTDSPLQNPVRGVGNVVAEGIRRGDAALSGRDREAVPFDQAFVGGEGSLFPGPSQFDVAPGQEGLERTGQALSGGIEILTGLVGGGGTLLGRAAVQNGKQGVARLSQPDIERELATRIANRNIVTAEQINVLRSNPDMMNRFTRGTLSTAKRLGGFADNLPDTMLLRVINNPRGSTLEEGSAIAGGVAGGAFLTNFSRARQGDEGEIESTALSGDIGTIVGSIFSPGAFLANRARVTVPKAFTSVSNLFGRGDKSKVQAAVVVREMANQAGLDPDALVRRLDTELGNLKEAGVQGAENLPADVVLGDNFLGTLRENFGADLPGRVAKNLKEAGQRDVDQFTSGLLKLSQRLRQSNDPELAEAAVVAEREAVLSMMQNQEAEAFGQLNRTFLEIFPEDVARTGNALDDAANLAARRAEAGVKVHETLEDALQEANRIDALLWNDFGKGVTVKAQGLRPMRETVEGIRAEVGQTGRIPEISRINEFLEEGASVEQLTRLRSDFLTEARRMRGDQNFPGARTASQLADSIDNVLLAIGGDELGVMREFTRQKRDLFTRSFAGRALASDRQGADKVRPQDILEMAVKFRSQDRVAVEFSELQEAGLFGDLAAGISGGRSEALDTLRAENRFNEATGGSISRGEFMESILGFDTPMGTDILNEGRVFLRSTMSNFVDDDGNFDARQFSRFVRNNASTIRDIGGGVKEMVQDVNLAQRFFDDLVDENKTASKSMLMRRVFAEITGTDGNPTTRIKPLLRDGLQPKDFDSFLTAARNAEEDGLEGAVGGFQATILKAAEELAEDSGGGLDWHRFDSVLNSSTRNRPSVIQQMTDSEIIDSAAAERLQAMIDVGKRTELSFSDPELAVQLGFGRKEAGSMFENLAAGAVGSVAATAAARKLGLLNAGGSGPSLVIAQGGASISRAFLNQALDDSTHTALMRGLNSADEFKTMMQATNPENFRRIYNKVNAMAIAAGINNLGDFDSTMQVVSQELEEARQQFFGDDLPPIPEGEPEQVGTPIPEEQQEQPVPEQEPDFFEQLR